MLRTTGLYFEDYEVGMQVTTAGRTITETDIVNFAGLSGDFVELHVNAEYAKQHPFGQRVAHGMLVASIATGLATQTGMLRDTVLAFRELETWKFSQPVLINDTVRVTLVVTEVKAMARLGGGMVTFEVKITNQDAKTVQSGIWKMLVMSRPTE